MYHLIRERSGGRESVISRWAAWLYGLGGAGFVLMFMLSGAMSVPRRFAEHISAWQVPDQISVGFVGLITLALLWLGSETFWRLGRAWREQ
jgi:cytochrome c oxidase subunit 1